jgi:hypothetical protein
MFEFFAVKKDLVRSTARLICYYTLAEAITSTGYSTRETWTDEDYLKHKLYQAMMVNKFTTEPGQPILILERKLDLDQTYWHVLVGEKLGWLNPRFGSLWTYVE